MVRFAPTIGDDPRNPEHNYGLLDLNGAEKPAMTAFRTLTRLAADHTFAGMVPDVPDGAHAMRLNGNGDKVYAVWSDQPDSRITVRFKAEGFVSATNLLGEPLNLKEGGQRDLEIALTETGGPVYIKFRPQDGRYPVLELKRACGELTLPAPEYSQVQWSDSWAATTNRVILFPIFIIFLDAHSAQSQGTGKREGASNGKDVVAQCTGCHSIDNTRIY